MSFERAAELFEALCELDPRERGSALERSNAAPEVLELVRVMLAGEQRAVSALDRPLGLDVIPAALDRVGEYELLRVLGEGGMGVVHEAQQSEPRRKVALKLLRPGFVNEEMLARFRDEADVLGRLDHPGIARVYDAGTATVGTHEVPYIAMELVEGEHVNEYVARVSPSIDARIDLLARLAETVHHAHRRGIVHRDLKPANILVATDGSIRVLDFGIASIMGQGLAGATRHTRTGELLGTLPYMSPEQAAGDPAQVDIRSDVYALGVIAYELLAGQRPLDLSDSALPEAARRIAEEEPTALGQVDARLAGDLELVIGKALAKNKDRRYASAEEFSRDLRRKLADEPVLARPPSRAYRTTMFARRHRALIGGLAAAVLLMIAGTVMASTQYFEQTALLDRRQQEADKAGRAIRFLEETLEQSEPYSGEELRLSDLTRMAARRLEGEFQDRPAVRARLLVMLGSAQKNLSLSDEALPLLEEALSLHEVQLGTTGRELATVLAMLGQVRHNVLDLDGAIGDQTRAIALMRQEGPSRLLAETLSELASTHMDRSELEQAQVLQEEALAMHVALAGEDDPETLSIRQNIAVRRLFEGDLAASEEELRAVLHDMAETSGSRGSTLLMLSYNLRSQRRLKEAESALREALELAERRYGRQAGLSRTLLRELGNVLSHQGRVREAVELQREVRAIVHRRIGPSTVEGVRATHDLAFALHDLPDKTEAEELYLEAILGFEDLGPGLEAMGLQAQHNLAQLYFAIGELEYAEEVERDSLEGRIELLGESDEGTLASWRGLCDIVAALGRREEALELRRKIVELCADEFGSASANTQSERLKLVDMLLSGRAFSEAEASLLSCEQALAAMPNSLGYPRRVAGQYVRLYTAMGRERERARWQELLESR